MRRRCYNREIIILCEGSPMAENYEVLESYKRFNQKNTASRRCEWDSALNHISTSNKAAIKKHIEKGHKGF